MKLLLTTSLIHKRINNQSRIELLKKLIIKYRAPLSILKSRSQTNLVNSRSVRGTTGSRHQSPETNSAKKFARVPESHGAPLKRQNRVGVIFLPEVTRDKGNCFT